MNLQIPIHTDSDKALQAEIDAITNAANATEQAAIDRAANARIEFLRRPFDVVTGRLSDQPAAPPPQRPQAPPPYQPPAPTPQMPDHKTNELAELEAQIEAAISVGNVAAIQELTLELAEARRNA